jgi:DNA-binding NarL/FixJ family response regulator
MSPNPSLPSADAATPGHALQPLRLLLCDDHALFREGLAALLQRAPGRQVVAEAATGAESIRLAAELEPDAVLLDVGLPDITGIDAAAAIRKAAPGCAIVALSMYADTHYVERMLHAGALAYVLKNDASGELLLAVDAAVRGERFLSRTLRETASPEDTADSPLGRCADIDRDLLTTRERQVLCLLARGRRAKEVAEDLGISVKTVETYRSRLMHKLGIDNLVGLVKFAIRAGLVTAE